MDLFVGFSLFQILTPIIIGLVLGLLGGGGAILTVPALVYLYNFDPKIAIATSLITVGTTALFASFVHISKKHVDIIFSVIFGLFGMLGAFLSAKYISSLFSGNMQLIIFSALVLLMSILMLSKKSEYKEQVVKKHGFIKYLLAAVIGSIIGVITAIVGIGGGFLIVPAMVLLLNLPMQKAVGSSLIIIFMQSMSGSLGYYTSHTPLPFKFIIFFTGLTVLGAIIGANFSSKVPAATLKKAFAYLLIAVAIFTALKSI